MAARVAWHVAFAFGVRALSVTDKEKTRPPDFERARENNLRRLQRSFRTVQHARCMRPVSRLAFVSAVDLGRGDGSSS